MDSAVAWAVATPAESKPHNIRLSLADSFDRLGCSHGCTSDYARAGIGLGNPTDEGLPSFEEG